MSDSDETIDRLLRESLGDVPLPALPWDFEARLQATLENRSVRKNARRPLLIYAGVGFVACVLSMAASGLDWRISTLSILLPAAATFPVVRPFLRR